MNASEFGRMIRARRKAKRLSQRDLAAAIDTGERFIVDLESGKETCQLGKALAVAFALGIVLTDSRQHDACPPDEDDDDLPVFDAPPTT
jgi:y4mF family transcriptional regulator